MGNCISNHKNSIASHKKRHGRPSQKPISQKFKLPRPSQIQHIISNPNEGNIYEKYKLGRELGRGEFGVTYHCVEMETGEAYACKRIAKEKLKTDMDVDDVRREVEIMRSLPKHPNIVSFKEAYEDEEACYLVMELCQGGELFDRIVAKGPYTERAAAKIAKTILEIVKVIFSMNFGCTAKILLVFSCYTIPVSPIFRRAIQKNNVICVHFKYLNMLILFYL